MLEVLIIEVSILLAETPLGMVLEKTKVCISKQFVNL